MNDRSDQTSRPVLHCWEVGPATDDGCSTTCMLERDHAGAHDWSRDDEIVVKRMATQFANGNLYPQSNARQGRGGWREFGGKRSYYRSTWEANYGRYLEWLKQRGNILEWEHEPETFWFEKIRRGTRSYLPDFRVTERNGKTVYHEVKGWMDDRSATKLKRMKIYHPTVTVILIDQKQYASIRMMMSRIIPGWETNGKPTIPLERILPPIPATPSTSPRKPWWTI